MFPKHVQLVYHTQALKQVRTQNASFKKKAKKVHSVQYPDIHCYRISSWVYYHCWGNCDVKTKSRGLSIIPIYMILMGLQARLFSWSCPDQEVENFLQGDCSLHLHIAQQKPLFHSSLKHPGTKTSACDPITKKTKKIKQLWEHTSLFFHITGIIELA